jgi:hypothetical protein
MGSSSHSSSTKAHNGSSRSTSSRSSGSSHGKSHKHSHSSKEGVERYVQDERDYKSYAVKDYDPCQEAARRKHSEMLRDVVGKV